MKKDYVIPKFSDTKFMSAADKEKVFVAFGRFVKSGFALSRFSKALYHHLYQHCGFDAKYTQRDFWEYYFFYFSRNGKWNEEVQEFFSYFISTDDQMCGIFFSEGFFPSIGEATRRYRRDHMDINFALSDIARDWLVKRFPKALFPSDYYDPSDREWYIGRLASRADRRQPSLFDDLKVA
jgi:hypothetical protein